MGGTAFITHADCWLHTMGALHPECPDRLSAIRDQLIASGTEVLLKSYDAPQASLDQLTLAHSPSYVQMLFDSVPTQGITHLDPDTAMCPQTMQAALRAAGAGVLATDLVLRGEVNNAFCAVRPPGHHAERKRAMGFCFFNNIAVAAAYALEMHDLARVAIIDFDVHHGNGTENIFAGDERVLMVSFFQHPFYPYSGSTASAGNMLNVPLAAGTRGDKVREVFEQQWLPALQAHGPSMLFISAGFDAHIEDDMASMGLLESDYAWLTDRLREFAEEHCAGRIVSMLEGGYALSALGRSAVAHIKALAKL